MTRVISTLPALGLFFTIPETRCVRFGVVIEPSFSHLLVLVLPCHWHGLQTRVDLNSAATFYYTTLRTPSESTASVT